MVDGPSGQPDGQTSRAGLDPGPRTRSPALGPRPPTLPDKDLFRPIFWAYHSRVKSNSKPDTQFPKLATFQAPQVKAFHCPGPAFVYPTWGRARSPSRCLLIQTVALETSQASPSAADQSWSKLPKSSHGLAGAGVASPDRPDSTGLAEMLLRKQAARHPASASPTRPQLVSRRLAESSVECSTADGQSTAHLSLSRNRVMHVATAARRAVSSADLCRTSLRRRCAGTALTRCPDWEIWNTLFMSHTHFDSLPLVCRPSVRFGSDQTSWRPVTGFSSLRSPSQAGASLSAKLFTFFTLSNLLKQNSPDRAIQRVFPRERKKSLQSIPRCLHKKIGAKSNDQLLGSGLTGQIPCNRLRLAQV